MVRGFFLKGDVMVDVYALIYCVNQICVQVLRAHYREKHIYIC
jgi:hypothetical protein